MASILFILRKSWHKKHWFAIGNMQIGRYKQMGEKDEIVGFYLFDLILPQFDSFEALF